LVVYPVSLTDHNQPSEQKYMNCKTHRGFTEKLLDWSRKCKSHRSLKKVKKLK